MEVELMEKQAVDTPKEFALENAISTAVKIPGVKVNRNDFLSEVFKNEDVVIEDILEFGPIEANCSREMLLRLANKQIIKRTSESSVASFLAGIPGGLAMAATVPADILQFFGMALRLAQELSYLYGAKDLWEDGNVSEDRIRNQLIMYCGVMFGVSGAAAGVRVLSAQIAKTALKKLPQKALTKTFWYPIIKGIGKAIGVKITKTTVAQGVSKAVPVIGGVISGGMNFASMMPMSKRLLSVLDSSCFDYNDEKMGEDIDELEHFDNISTNDEHIEHEEILSFKNKVTNNMKKVGSGISGAFNKHKNKNGDIIANIEKLSKLKDLGAITQEEFETKKKELLDKM